MNVPDDLRYAETHEWLRLDGDVATIGITDHAQAELTDIVYVELPKPDAEFSATQPAAVVESVKAASDIYAPVAGRVVEINAALSADPGLVNRDPYGEGWLFKMNIAPGAAEGLKTSAQYREQISGSAH